MASAGRAAIVPLFVLACAAQAAAPGSISDYRLPPGPGASPPPVQGPVDPEAPGSRLPRPPATPAATPTPTIIVPSSTQAATPTPAASPTRRPQRATQTPEPAPAPVATPSASEPAATQAPIATPPAVPSTAPLPETTPPAGESRPNWLWIALAAIGALLVMAGMVWIRRRRRPEEDAPETPIDEARGEDLPEAGPPATLPPVQLSAAPAQPQPEPPGAGLELQLEASQLSRSLVYATLAYRLTLTNRTDARTPPARILADLISAHASLPMQEQLSLDVAALQPRHEIPALTPGESLSLAGDLRIAVATIRPIMQGGAALFVPLARFRIETPDEPDGDHVFVVGQPAEQPGGALKPLRIDSLPGVVRPLDQRRITASAA